MASAVMEPYTYVFAFGTMFALLEAYNNGASMYLVFISHNSMWLVSWLEFCD